ncbi:DegV family protein [Sporosarcina sp. JAI121]|uniref:DegV family protein n=1 Tax=Sporosarcina sp. JAI121 TaxID=2723064 RepID=UPI0015CC09D4|nr:DegV family protein [Sporosarcina sp. JAI121]NYF23392.1 DegV family protein with EDD domain [Sporosarcina sp. JAI121]
MTKKPLAWIVDSTAYISEELSQHPDFFSVPLNIHFGEKQFVDGVDLNPEQLYSKIKNAEEFPKSSQPSAGEFAERFRVIAENYEQAIAVHVSSKLSGTLASSIAGAEIADFPVTFIDSLSLSYGITGLIEQGMEMHESGATVPEIDAKLTKMAGTVHNYILIGQLEQLYKGGRMSGAQFFLGSLLKVKPIVHITNEGELEAVDKVRSEKKAFQYLVDKVAAGHHAGRRKVHLMHGNVLDQAIHLKNLLTEQVPGLEVEIGDISSVLAVHAGEGTLAILWFD